MEQPIEAKVFLVRTEDQAEAMDSLEKAGTPFCTFPHHSGDYVAIAAGTGTAPRKSKSSPAPPPVPGFPGTGGQ